MYNYTRIYEYLCVNWGWGNVSNQLTYSYQQIADLYDTPLTIYSNLFRKDSIIFNSDIKMITGIQPN